MTIGLHNLHPKSGARHKVKRLGRGNASGRGTTAGKGTKGQRARQGGRKGLRGLGMKYMIQSTPKLGGFASIHAKIIAVPVSVLNQFKAGTTVSPKTLAQNGIVPVGTREVKFIGDAKVKVALTVTKCSATASAQKQITAAGGTFVQ